MEKCYITETHILFGTNYSTISTNVYCTLKIEEISNPTIFVHFSFLQLRNITWTYSKFSKTIFLKLIFHLRITYQLNDVRFARTLYTFSVCKESLY